MLFVVATLVCTLFITTVHALQGLDPTISKTTTTTTTILNRKVPPHQYRRLSPILRFGKRFNDNDYDTSKNIPPFGEIYSNVFDLYPEDDPDIPGFMTPPTTMRSSVDTGAGTTTFDRRNDKEDSRFSLWNEPDTNNDEYHHPTQILDQSLKYFPMVLPFLAYVAYDPTAELFAYTLDALSQSNWVAVDGGAYQAKIIAPAVNGVVVPAISILFANLIGTTIQTLRQRQFDIQTCLHMEAGQLRILSSLCDVFPNMTAQTCRRYLTQYATRLIAESQPAMTVESLDYSLDTELNAILAELNRLSSISATTSITTTTTPATTTSPVNALLLGNAYTACSKLYEERAKRITALRSLFPPLHFVIVTALAVSICIAFLLESKQDILVFLNAIQLRILWTMLVGTFTALAIVCYDLGNPFRGSYQISKSVHQLYLIRMTLRASLQSKNQQRRRRRQQQQQQEESIAAAPTPHKEMATEAFRDKTRDLNFEIRSESEFPINDIRLADKDISTTNPKSNGTIHDPFPSMVWKNGATEINNRKTTRTPPGEYGR